SEPVKVEVRTASSSAQAGIDFLGKTEVLTFLPTDPDLDGDGNILTQTFSVEVLSDALLEADEEFFVQLASANGAEIAEGIAVGRIRDDDAIMLSIDNVTQPENGQFAFAVTLSERPSDVVTVEVSTAETAN